MEYQYYETPKQFEERTGKPCSDSILVFYRLKDFAGKSATGPWCSAMLGSLRRPGSFRREMVQAVIAYPPTEPDRDVSFFIKGETSY